MKLVTITLGLVGMVVLAGCGSEPEVKESEQSKQMAAESASKWTPEAKAAFEKAHKEAREGKDGK